MLYFNNLDRKNTCLGLGKVQVLANLMVFPQTQLEIVATFR